MTVSQKLAAAHDVLLVDLDGTLRLAGDPVPHAAASLVAAAESGARSVIVTNNPSRSPQQVAQALTAMGFSIEPGDVVTSAQVAATMLAKDHPVGARVLVLGTEALCDAVADAGLTPVRQATDEPVAVVQGHSPQTCWGDLAEACIAIRSGADWVATNTDPTLPTDRGQLPGNGSMVQALVTATGLNPRVAGKPGRELLDAGLARSGARRPLVVGDRLDTDIAAAVAAGMPSLFVLTGVSTAADLLAAPVEMRPTFVSMDLRGLVDPAAVGVLDTAGRVERGTVGGSAGGDSAGGDSAGGDSASGGSAGGNSPKGVAVAVADDRLELRTAHGHADSGSPDPMAALAALAAAAWRTGITRTVPGDEQSAAVLAELGLA